MCILIICADASYLWQNLSLTMNHPLRQCCPWKSTRFLITNKLIWSSYTQITSDKSQVDLFSTPASTLSIRPGNFTSSFGQIGIYSTSNLPSGSARITWGSSHAGQVRKSTWGYCTGKGNEAACRHVFKVSVAFLFLTLPFIKMKSLIISEWHCSC